MKPIDFKEANKIYGLNQPEYQPLKAYLFETDIRGQIISLWKANIWDRIKILFTGKVWLSQLTFHKPLQPQSLTTEYPFIKNKFRNNNLPG